VQEGSVGEFVNKLKGLLVLTPKSEQDKLCSWLTDKFPDIPTADRKRKDVPSRSDSDGKRHRDNKSGSPSTTSCPLNLGSLGGETHDMSGQRSVDAPETWWLTLTEAGRELEKLKTQLELFKGLDAETLEVPAIIQKIQLVQGEFLQVQTRICNGPVQAVVNEFRELCTAVGHVPGTPINVSAIRNHVALPHLAGALPLGSIATMPPGAGIPGGMPGGMPDGMPGGMPGMTLQLDQNQNSCGNGGQGGPMRTAHLFDAYKERLKQTKAPLSHIQKALNTDAMEELGQLFVQRNRTDSVIKWLKEQLQSGKAFEAQAPHKISVVDYLKEHKTFKTNKAFHVWLEQQRPQ